MVELGRVQVMKWCVDHGNYLDFLSAIKKKKKLCKGFQQGLKLFNFDFHFQRLIWLLINDWILPDNIHLGGKLFYDVSDTAQWLWWCLGYSDHDKKVNKWSSLVCILGVDLTRFNIGAHVCAEGRKRKILRMTAGFFWLKQLSEWQCFWLR